MKKIFSFIFLLLFSAVGTNGQDSLHVSFCSYSSADCFGLPSLNKTIEHIDSTGNTTQLNFYDWERCDQDYLDSDYIHMYDYFYQYDSLQRLVTTTYNYFNGDTSFMFQFIYYYSYDSLGNQVSMVTHETYPSVQDLSFDTTAYTQSNSKTFHLAESWNQALLELDTNGYQEWLYDSLDRLSISNFSYYSNFIFQYIYHTYYYYDTLSNLIAQIYSYQHPVLDSNRVLFVNDTLNRNIETWYQKWDTTLLVWKSQDRNVFIYDSLSRVAIRYNFNCYDSLCDDSSGKIVYEYDLAGHLTETKSYDYDNPGWLFTGNSYENYDPWNYITSEGWWYVNFEGCDESDHHSYDYNADHQLVHSYAIHYTCNYAETECDYFSLNQDSLLVMISAPQVFCPYDTVHFQVTVAGGTPPYIYQWSPAINIQDTTVESPEFITDTTTIYTLTVIDSFGLTRSAADTLFVHPKNLHPVSIWPIGIPCVGNPFSLTFNSDSLIQPWSADWQFNGHSFGAGGDTLEINYPGDYSLKVYDLSTGCSVTSYNVIPVSLFPHPEAIVTTPGDTQTCFGNSIVLVSNYFPQVTWNTGDTSNVIYAAATGSYFSMVVDSNGCMDTSNIIHVVIHANPIVSLGNDTALCADQVLILDAGIGYVNYEWQDGSSSQFFTANASAGDTLICNVNVTDAYGCADTSDAITIIFHSLPVAALGNDTTLCITQSILLDAGNGFQAYLWQDGSTFQTFTAASFAADTLIYFVRITDLNACSSTDSVQVIFDVCAGLVNVNNLDFSVYPNPAGNWINISIQQNEVFGNISFSLLNSEGRIVFFTRLTKPVEQVSLSVLAKGVYQFMFEGNTGALKKGKLVVK